MFPFLSTFRSSLTGYCSLQHPFHCVSFPFHFPQFTDWLLFITASFPLCFLSFPLPTVHCPSYCSTASFPLCFLSFSLPTVHCPSYCSLQHPFHCVSFPFHFPQFTVLVIATASFPLCFLFFSLLTVHCPSYCSLQHPFHCVSFPFLFPKFTVLVIVHYSILSTVFPFLSTSHSSLSWLLFIIASFPLCFLSFPLPTVH